MNAKEVKRKPRTSFTYGPCPITSLMPWKKDMGSDPTRQNSGWRKNAKVNQDVDKIIASMSFFFVLFFFFKPIILVLLPFCSLTPKKRTIAQRI